MQKTTAEDPIVIKRYCNRKLYNTNTSNYITIDELASLIKNGASISVIENKTDKDITSATLASIVLETEKKSNRRGSARVLESIIKRGSITDFLSTDHLKKEKKIEFNLDDLEHDILKEFNKRLSLNEIKKLLKMFNKYLNIVISRLRYNIEQTNKLESRKFITLKKHVVELESEIEDLKKRNIDDFDNWED